MAPLRIHADRAAGLRFVQHRRPQGQRHWAFLFLTHRPCGDGRQLSWGILEDRRIHPMVPRPARVSARMTF